MGTSRTAFDTVESLILDMLEWIGPSGRPGDEVLDAWRTSCPRLPVWEDATDQGLVARRLIPGQGVWIDVTPAGAAFLGSRRL